MSSSLQTVQILKSPEVKSYLVNVFGIDISPEQKYERLLEFFTRHSDLEQKIALLGRDFDDNVDHKALVSAAAKDLGIWDPEQILADTETSIQKGLARIAVSQHSDGGWGYYWEQTSAWATAYSLLALEAARLLHIAANREQVEKGFCWLITNYEKWSLADISPRGWSSIYEASLVIRCFLRTNRSFAPVMLSLREMLKRQNADGGWDPAYRGFLCADNIQLRSEIGATSMAIQALAATEQPESVPAIENGLHWILTAQQPDGCWISGPSDNPLDNPNQPSLSKTCDALSGIAAAGNSGAAIDCSRHVAKAVDWICQQEKFLSNSAGWGYDQAHESGKSSDLVSTGLVLEAFVETHGIAPPLIAPYARLLMAAQFNDPGNLEDGSWKCGDTFRITLALIQFWAKLSGSQTASASQIGAATSA